MYIIFTYVSSRYSISVLINLSLKVFHKIYSISFDNKGYQITSYSTVILRENPSQILFSCMSCLWFNCGGETLLQHKVPFWVLVTSWLWHKVIKGNHLPCNTFIRFSFLLLSLSRAVASGVGGSGIIQEIHVVSYKRAFIYTPVPVACVLMEEYFQNKYVLQPVTWQLWLFGQGFFITVVMHQILRALLSLVYICDHERTQCLLSKGK